MRSFFLLLFFAIFLSGFGQSNSEKEELIVGIKSGAALSTISFEPQVANSGYKPAYIVGALFRYSGEANFAFQAEVNYLEKGFAASGASREFSYLQVPIVSHFYLGGKFRGFLDVGPYASFLIASRVKGENTEEKAIAEPIKRGFDYGIVAGLGMEYHTKFVIFQVSGRYDFGFGDIFANSNLDNFRRSANRGFVFTLGALFDFVR